MDPIDFLIEATRKAFEEKGSEIVERVKEDLGVPVGRVGKKKKRSTRGDHPRKDTGRLQAGISHQVRHDEDVVQLEISSSAPYSKELEDEYQRVVLSDVPDRFGDELVNEIAALIEESPTTDQE